MESDGPRGAKARGNSPICFRPNETDSISGEPAAAEEPDLSTPPLNQILAMYQDSTVLITGGTGFLGKVLLEKVLRCLNVRKVFLMIRKKDDLSAQDRLRKLLDDAIFEKARKCYKSDEQLFAKLEAVQIELEEENLSLQKDPGTERQLLDETEIVFNVLASVKFNESIRNAVRTNVAGTRKILCLTQRMTRLRSVVHVSTLYSNCNRKLIKEVIYDDTPMQYKLILELTESLGEQEMDQLQHCLLGEMPNTYTFSKKCAEVMIREEFSHLPIGIFRPPIVISTYREPLPGWTDNLNGPSGLCMWTVRGWIRTIWGNASKKANLVPVDYCVNAMLVAAFDVMNRTRRIQSIPPEMTTTTTTTMDAADKRDNWKEDNFEGCQLPGKFLRQELPTYNYMYPENNLTWGKYMQMVSLGFDNRLHQIVCSQPKFSQFLISTYREPLPGWTDNLNGPSGLCMWTVRGWIRTIWGNASKKANLVPVDYCVNAMLVAAFDVMNRTRRIQSIPPEMTTTTTTTMDAADKRDNWKEDNFEGCQLPGKFLRQELPTYNYMYPENNLTWGKYMQMVSLGFDNRLHQIVWNYSFIITSNRHLFRMFSFLGHTIPAVLLDFVRRLRRKKPIYRKALQKSSRFLEMMSFFGLREWSIESDNIRRLRQQLSAEESRCLEFDMGTINWTDYFRSYIPGIRRYWFGDRVARIDSKISPASRRFFQIQRLLKKLIWIWICVRCSCLTSKFVLQKLFVMLIAL
ncbi:fatty acyl-CoA reductase wat-like [Uranotaenia lowii]|uniref:fatty acyl-CoA reductase wat-like n=1 Tax=Uranotaenia lowii TaxID=190385 RepID=UPI00247B1E45|nr:fatty acyl-CoA reductase wat-like [Uranotaenia lowii]